MYTGQGIHQLGIKTKVTVQASAMHALAHILL